MNRTISVIAKIKKTPGLWLEEWSIIRLWLWLEGYRAALKELNALDDSEKRLLQEFGLFVEKEYGRRHSSMGWAKMILSHCEGFDPKTYDEFFRLFEKYLPTIGIDPAAVGLTVVEK